MQVFLAPPALTVLTAPPFPEQHSKSEWSSDPGPSFSPAHNPRYCPNTYPQPYGPPAEHWPRYPGRLLRQGHHAWPYWHHWDPCCGRVASYGPPSDFSPSVCKDPQGAVRPLPPVELTASPVQNETSSPLPSSRRQRIRTNTGPAAAHSYNLSLPVEGRVPGSLTAPSQIALRVQKAILQSAQSVWHAPASYAPTPKRVERCFSIPTKDTDFLFTHPQPNSSVVQAAMNKARQQHFRSTPPD